MPEPAILIFPVSVLRHADDVYCPVCHLAYVLDEVDAVKPAVCKEISGTDASLPCAADHSDGHLRLFLVKYLLPLVAGTSRVTLLTEQPLAFPCREAVVAFLALLGVERTVKRYAALAVEEAKRKQFVAQLVPAKSSSSRSPCSASRTTWTCRNGTRLSPGSG